MYLSNVFTTGVKCVYCRRYFFNSCQWLRSQFLGIVCFRAFWDCLRAKPNPPIPYTFFNQKRKNKDLLKRVYEDIQPTHFLLCYLLFKIFFFFIQQNHFKITQTSHPRKTIIRSRAKAAFSFPHCPFLTTFFQLKRVLREQILSWS